MYALFLKRTFMFFNRYIIAIFTLFLPFVLEIVIFYANPSLPTSLLNHKTSSGTYNLNILNYKPYTMPYALTGNISLTNFQNLMQVMYTSSNRPGITLNQIGYDNISNYILQQRKADTLNLVSNYYTGMSFNLVNSTLIYANAYYSTFAYHSPGSILNEISNIILAFLNSNNLSQTITTYNKPITSNSISIGNDIMDYLPCIDSLPLSFINISNALIVSFIIGILVIHVGREQSNGSKSLQLISGTHFLTYWSANYFFDLVLCFINVIMIFIAIKFIRKDSSIELNEIGNDSKISFFLLLFCFSMLSWPIYAYIMSFILKSDVSGFIVLTTLLGMAAVFDIIFSFLQFIVQMESNGVELISEKLSYNKTNLQLKNNLINNLFLSIRWILVVLCPNVTIKRGIFNLKIMNNTHCLRILNTLFNCKKHFLKNYVPFMLKNRV